MVAATAAMTATEHRWWRRLPRGMLGTSLEIRVTGGSGRAISSASGGSGRAILLGQQLCSHRRGQPIKDSAAAAAAAAKV